LDKFIFMVKYQKYIVKNIETGLYFDCAIIDSTYHVAIWTKELKRAIQYDAVDSGFLLYDLEESGVKIKNVEIIPIVVSISLDK